jgi:acetyl esterase/lipase
MKNKISLLILALLFQTLAYSQEVRIDSVIYKKKDTVSLALKIYYPPSMDESQKYPGMLFFQGGNWNYGKMEKFEYHAKYFAKRGVVCFLVEYGIKGSKEAKFYECIADAKSSVRFIKQNAIRFKLDTNKIIAAGGSAGGHLASSLVFVEGYDDPNDNMAFDAKPNALVLFNPAIDFGPASPSLYARVGEHYKDISSLHNIKPGAPPTIILNGTADPLIPVEMVKYYKLVMDAVGSRCDLILYEGERHGFFNYTRSIHNYEMTVIEVDKFLNSLGYIEGEPTIKLKD